MMRKHIISFATCLLVFMLSTTTTFGQIHKVVRSRTCTVCKKEKSVSDFSGDSKTCKTCTQKVAEQRRREQQEAENRRQQQLKQERLAREQAERERLAREQAEQERLAREQAERERIALRDKVNSLINMVYVEGGTFTMGATPEQGSDAQNDEKPAHQVTLSSYYIGKYEVTQELWETVMGSNPSKFKGSKRPVENVSWEDCQAFIKKLNSLTGQTFRLPTEAEWEYAARGGNKSRGTKYAGGSEIGSVAWYGANSFDKGSPDYGTHPVGQKQSNELGLYDMSGNVYEWCKDWYGNYSSGSQTNPQGPSSGSSRVVRGGGWNDDAGFCRVSYRLYDTPSFRRSDLGLRLAR